MKIEIIILNILALIFLPFLMVGIIKKTKAFFGGRKGASIFQPIYDFIKLMKKESIYANTTTGIFKYAPIISLVCIIFASFFIPLIKSTPLINIQGGFIIFAYSLGLSKFISLLASGEIASSFEGMGESREASFTTIVEPAFFIIIASIMALSKVFDFNSLTLIVNKAGSVGYLIVLFAILALIIMLLTEGCRVPVDDPDTHLELTMIHEVMVLDNSGKELALISYGAYLKMFLIASMIAALIVPQTLSLLNSVLIYFGIIFLISILIGIIESSIARFRMSHVLEFVFVMSSFALVVASLIAVKIWGV